MSDKVKIENNAVINVIEDLDPTVQRKEYNDLFRKWRKQKNNSCGFKFETNTRERIYNDSRGFENKSLKDAERSALRHIMRRIGYAMLIYIVIEKIIGTSIIALLDLIGFDIHTNLFSPSVYGGSAEIVAVILSISCISLIAPSIYLHKKMKMPLRVEFMSTVNDSLEILSSIGMALVVCTIVCLPSAYSSDTKDIYNYFKTIDADVSVWGQGEFVVYIIFEVLIFAVLTEVLLRGAIFGALRQFGDRFAIIMTSIVAALLMGDLYEIPAEVLISIVASVGMLRSGTIVSAFFVRIIYKLYQFTLVILQGENSPEMVLHRNFFMIAVFITGVVLTASIQLSKGRKDKKVLADYSSEVRASNRFAYALRMSPFTAVAGVCFIQALVRIAF